MEVEGHVVGFGEDVEVDVVEFEEIVHFEGTCGGHDGLIFGVFWMGRFGVGGWLNEKEERQRIHNRMRQTSR